MHDIDDTWDGGYVDETAELADLESMVSEGEACDLMADAIALDADSPLDDE